MASGYIDPNLQWPTFGQNTVGASNPFSMPSSTVSPAASQRNRFVDGLQSPEALAAIVSGGAGFGAALLQNRANSAENEKDREFQLAQLLAGMGGDAMSDLRARQQGYMNTFGMDPVSQSRDLFSANILRDLASRGATQAQPGQVSRFTPSDASMGFISPDALAENASRFYSAAGQLNPYALRPDLEGMGFGEAGAARQVGVDNSIDAAAGRYEDLNRQRREDLMMSIQGQQDQKKQGTSKKRKALGILGAIGAGIAAPFTGGASLAAVGPALRYGYGSNSRTGQVAGVASGVAGAVGSGTDYFNRR